MIRLFQLNTSVDVAFIGIRHMSHPHFQSQTWKDPFLRDTNYQRQLSISFISDP